MRNVNHHMIEQVDDMALGESDIISDKTKTVHTKIISNTQTSPATQKRVYKTTYSYH